MSSNRSHTPLRLKANRRSRRSSQADRIQTTLSITSRRYTFSSSN